MITTMQSYDEPINSLPLLHQGKVRDIYSIDEHNLLIVASDRISAFDVIMPSLIEGKGEILTQISSFWFEHLDGIIPSHINHDIKLKDIVSPADYDLICKRSMVVKKLKIVPIEAIARGYIIGSGWKDYLASTSICGIPLPSGLQKAEKLPQPLFTPSTKAELGDHDENISFAQMSASIGHDLAETIRTVTLELYQKAADFALTKGIIIADTKFEFGLDQNGDLHLADEILTPDSSRFWPLEHYALGVSPPSFDKQFVRDYLESLTHWDKKAPGPELPDDISINTLNKYKEALSLLTS